MSFVTALSFPVSATAPCDLCDKVDGGLCELADSVGRRVGNHGGSAFRHDVDVVGQGM